MKASRAFLVLLAGSISLAFVLAAGCGDDDDGAAAPPPQAPPTEFTNADTARGGALYDEFWEVTGGAEPTTDHPLWALRPDTVSNPRTGADTWRCKECHGWDYRGVDGAYGTGDHRTGVAGVFGTTKTAQEVFDLIKDSSDDTPGGHSYGAAGLSDADIWDVTRFVLQGQIDTTAIIDSSARFTGSASTGLTLYNSGIGANPGCALCHGADGRQILFHDGTETLGLLANENPWELQHKIRFGQPGTAMPGAFDEGTLQDVADVGTFAQTLPQEP